MNWYQSRLRPLLFRADPEWVHCRALDAAALAARWPAACRWLDRLAEYERRKAPDAKP